VPVGLSVTVAEPKATYLVAGAARAVLAISPTIRMAAIAAEIVRFM
jgi:hypothetical protein